MCIELYSVLVLVLQMGKLRTDWALPCDQGAGASVVFSLGPWTWASESWGGRGFGAPEMSVTPMALCFLC